MVHYSDPNFVSGDGARVLSCGQALNRNYSNAKEFATYDVCKRCRVNAVKDGVMPKVGV